MMLKLWVLGSKSSDPKDWFKEHFIALVIAKNPTVARRLIRNQGFNTRGVVATQVPITKSAFLLAHYELDVVKAIHTKEYDPDALPDSVKEVHIE